MHHGFAKYFVSRQLQPMPSSRTSEESRRAAQADRFGPVAGVVLAAGASTRMGRNNLMLELGGEAMVRRAVKAALAAGLDPAAAKAAGLVAKPEKASCTAKCHKPAEFKDEMLAKVHDKKPKK